MENNQETIKVLKSHCLLCFQTLYAYLNKQQLPIYPSYLSDAKCPLFVTWQKGPTTDLRGCIGTFDNSSLLSYLLPKYALQSALKDPRFSPISLSEFPSLSVAVSFLINFEYPESIWDWQVGIHGISIEFEYPDQLQPTKIKYYSGTYLPEVAKEQEWTKEEAMKSLIRKAGFNQNWDLILPKLKLERYQSSKLSMSYEEFMDEMKLQQQKEIK